MATKVKGQRLNEGAAVENLGFNPDKRPIQGEGEPTSVTPEYIGQQYVDTTENKMYFATGTEEGNREAVGAGGGEFDPTGYYPKLHAGITDQIYTDENTISIGDWNFRTTAGDVSVPSSGEAQLISIKGAPLRREGTDTLAQFEITTTGGLVAYVSNKYKFISECNNETNTYEFILAGGDWGDVDPTTRGLTVNQESITDGTITVNFTAEDRANLRAIRPFYLLATGVNQIGTPGWGRIENATIQNGEIVSGANYIMYVKAYGGVTNGYMARSVNADIVTVGRCANQPDFNTTITQNNIQGGVDEMWMSFEQTGYFVVEAANGWTEYDGRNSIHPRWSNQQGNNFDDYRSSIANTPSWTTEGYTLPHRDNYGYGMVGLPAIGDVYDEINISTGKYIQRIKYQFYDNIPSMCSFIADLPAGTRFEYDNHGVYYVLETENILNMNVDGEFSGNYTANDYGTEWILDDNYNLIEYPIGVKTSYGTNLVDKLRTGVPSKDQLPRVMFQQQYNDLSEEQKNNGAITFIYTADKPDSFNPINSNIDFESYPVNIILPFAFSISPEGYPFEVSITSDNTSIVSIIGTPYIEGGVVYCNIDILQGGTCTGTITIGGVTKTWVRDFSL